MTQTFYRAGDALPDDPVLQVIHGLTGAYLETAREMVATVAADVAFDGVEKDAAITRQRAASCLFSALLSAAVQLAEDHGAILSAIEHLQAAAVALRDFGPAAEPGFRTAVHFHELAKHFLADGMSAPAVQTALLNAVCNIGLGGDASTSAGVTVLLLEEFWQMLTDPTRIDAARAVAALANRAADAAIN